MKNICNERGSALASLLTLMPLIISIVITLASTFFLIQHMQKSSFICRTQVLQTQTQMLERMHELTQLNPEATELRAELQAAEEEVQNAAGFPPALAIATAHLASVVARQGVLATAQRGLIAAGNLQAQAMQLRTRMELQSLLGVHGATAQTSTMQVTAQQQGSLTPDYKPSSSIEKDQTMQLSWNIHPLQILPGWIQRIFNQQDFAIPSMCASRPTQNQTATGDSQWTAILKRDKPSLSSFSF